MSKPYYECLPFDVKPIHYRVDIHSIDYNADTYRGCVDIDVEVESTTDEIHLNYRDLEVNAADVLIVQNGRAEVATGIEFNKKLEYFVLKFPQTLECGPATITIGFSGIVQTNMAGFYKLSYPDGEETKYMYLTQFEATDARRAFPCFDEPARKATFDVQLVVPAKWTALGNMPVKSETPRGDDKVVVFETLPIMSTYLVAWAIGEFEYIELHTKDTYAGDAPLPCRIYTTKGLIEDAVFAASITPKIVDYFSQIFDIKYPLPKLDLLAVHLFSHNAMENWGLITYRATALLFNEKKLSAAYKKKVAYVVAHEVAHQWFGNLVTMAWWDELYENEAFATLIGYVAVDYLFPEWDIFAEFVSELIQSALLLDGLRNSHLIEVPVNDALDIDQVFDAISYLKGSSVLMMLQTYLGKDVFVKGVSDYLKANKYGNATTTDLFGAISAVLGKPVEEMMNPWIKKIGFPMVSLELVDEVTAKLTQSRFLNSGDVADDEDSTLWWIPLNATTETDVDAFDTKLVQITVPSGQFKLNSACSGFYRVKYSAEFLKLHILPYFGEMAPADKVGLIADAAFMAISGNSSTTEFIEFLTEVAPKLGDDYVVWLELGRVLGKFSVTFGGQLEELDDKLANFYKTLYSDKATEIATALGEATSPSLDYLKVSLQLNVLSKAGSVPIPAAVDLANKLYSKWIETGKIDPSFRGFVWLTIAASKDFTQEQFDAIFKQVTHPTSLDSREIALAALGHISNTDTFLQPLLDALIDPSKIPIMDAHFLGAPLSANTHARDLFWVFFRDNYDTFHKLMSTNMVVLDRFVKQTMCNYQSQEKYDEIKGFFDQKDVQGFERAYKQALDYIKIHAAWYERGHKEI